MYNESSERIFSIRSFILKIILVVLFVFLLMWLLPMPNLKPVYDRIFADNIETMKEAAKSYFTVERLPKEVNKSVKLTLDEMLNMKLLLPLVDSSNKLCNGSYSYVEVMKTDTEYLIKVNLSCPNKSGYIVEHLGCYDICSDKCAPTEEKEVVIKPTDHKPKQPKPPVKPPVDPPKPPVDPPVDPPKPPVTQYEYQYIQTTTITNPSYWSTWSAPIAIKKGETITYGVSADGTVKKEALPSQTGVVGYVTTYHTIESKTIYRNLNYIVGHYVEVACTSYDYVKFASTGVTYRDDGWSTPVADSTHYPSTPDDTETKRYTNIKPHYDNCSDVCTSIYYTADVSYHKYTKITSGPSSIDVSCSDAAPKSIKVEGTIKQSVLVPTKVEKMVQPITATINYYHQCTLTPSTTSTSTLEKWSSSTNDTTLINQGYHATGAKRVKQ